ncbi:hypothetical protein EV361DRAFT_874403, partial [Lentinula raphanica]
SFQKQNLTGNIRQKKTQDTCYICGSTLLADNLESTDAATLCVVSGFAEVLPLFSSPVTMSYDSPDQECLTVFITVTPQLRQTMQSLRGISNYLRRLTQEKQTWKTVRQGIDPYWIIQQRNTGRWMAMMFMYWYHKMR